MRHQPQSVPMDNPSVKEQSSHSSFVPELTAISNVIDAIRKKLNLSRISFWADYIKGEPKVMFMGYGRDEVPEQIKTEVDELFKVMRNAGVQHVSFQVSGGSYHINVS